MAEEILTGKRKILDEKSIKLHNAIAENLKQKSQETEKKVKEAQKEYEVALIAARKEAGWG